MFKYLRIFALILLPVFAPPIVAQNVRMWTDQGPDVRAWAFRPDSGEFATAGGDQRIRIWDLDRGGCKAVLAGHYAQITALAYGPDGQTLFSADRDGRLLLWKLGTDAPAQKLEGHPLSIQAVVAFPGSQVVLTSSHDRRAKIWDADSGEVLRRFGPFDSPITAVASGSNRVAILEQDGTLHIGNTTDPAPRRFANIPNGASAVAFSKDGRLLFVGCNDGSIRCWNLGDNHETPAIRGHCDAICSLDVSQDGRRLISLGKSGQCVLWDLSSGRALFSHRFPLPVVGASFAPNGRQAAVIAGGGRLYFFDTVHRLP